MLISISTYYATVIVFAAVIVAVALFFKFVKKTGNKFDFIFLFVLVLVPVNWFTPAVYTITKCGEYLEDVLILPTNLDGEKLDLGRHNYFINKSDSTLILEDVIYGTVDKEDILPTVSISPSKIYKAPFIHLDYAFETLPNTEKSKSSGVVKHSLSCE